VAIADPDLVAEVDVVVGQIRRIGVTAGYVSRCARPREEVASGRMAGEWRDQYRSQME